MTMGEALLPEFDNEMANTRKTLERVPDDKFSWKPHEKSGSMGWLASHVANIPSWAGLAINQDTLDLAPPGGQSRQAAVAGSTKQLLDTFDKNTASARAAISKASDVHLLQPWTLLKGGNRILTLPRIAVLRGFVMNHMIHHRAQLGVYLRLNNIPVPSIYGPSADEGSF